MTNESTCYSSQTAVRHSAQPFAEEADLLDHVDKQEELLEWAAYVQRFIDDLVSPDGAMAHVKDLINLYGVFVPSNSVNTSLIPLSRGIR